MAEQDWIIDNDWDDQDRRQYERYSTEFYLSVYEKEKSLPLGQVVDISLGGLQLVSSEPIPVNKHLHLWMDVSMESGRHEKIVFEAVSIWSGEDDDDDDSYNTGFQFINLSTEALASLQGVIDDLSA